jgi:thioester reductase-like protein
MFDHIGPDRQVRARDIKTAAQRIQDALRAYEIVTDETALHRIIPVVGDLAKPYFGMSEREFEQLALNVDAIYHNGAYVNHVFP